MMTAMFSCRQQQDTRQKSNTSKLLNVNCCLYVVGRRRPASEMQPRRDTDGRQLSPNQLWRASWKVSLSQTHTLGLCAYKGRQNFLSFSVLSKADRGHWCSNDHHRLGIRPSSPFGHFLDRHGTRAQKRRWTRFLSSHRRLCVCVRILCCTHGWCADQSIVTTHITRVLGNLIFFGL